MNTDAVSIGDVITRSDNVQYIIIEDNSSTKYIPPDIVQLPKDSPLAISLLGRHVGDPFNYSNEWTISAISHTQYKKWVDIEDAASKIKHSLNIFDFESAEHINNQYNIPDFDSLELEAINSLEERIYSKAYWDQDSASLADAITNAIRAGAISQERVIFIKKCARNERAKFDKQRASEKEWIKARRRENIFEIEKNKIQNQEYDNLLRLFHLTSIDNLESILANGIYSRARAEEELFFKDIAATGALMNHRYVDVYGEELDHYARCFFNPLPPMYYMKEKEGEKLCILEIWVPFEKVYEHGSYSHILKIIDSAKRPRYYKQSIASNKQDLSSIESNNLNEISWDSSYEAFDRNHDLCKAKRGAEVLIYDYIPNSYITDIYTDEDVEINHHKIANLRHFYYSGKPSIVKGEL